MKAAEGFMTAREAAAYVGYDPAPNRAAREDCAMRCFYAWATNHCVKKYRRGSRLLFRRSDLDRAIGETTDKYDSERVSPMDRMADLARRHASEGQVQ